jgi:hypothetical protein
MGKNLSVHNFLQAYTALKNMLEGKDSLNYEKAIFNYQRFLLLIEIYVKYLRFFRKINFVIK